MKSINNNKVCKKLLFLIIFSSSIYVYCQPVLPQRSITVNATQGLSFGVFYNRGGGGTISVDWQGIRSTTGDIIPLPNHHGMPMPAIYEVKLCQGRMISITYPETSTLTNSDQHSLTLDVGPTERGGNGAIFATENDCNFITILRVGGTLRIPPNTPIGKYTGSFEIQFNQQ